MPFEKELPIWEAPGIKPPLSKLQIGWEVNDHPPADWKNWHMNRTYQALLELQQKALHVELVGKENGIAPLDKDKKIPAEYISSIDIPDASTTEKGIVQLNDSVTSTSKTQAATANAVKTVNDKVVTLDESVTTHLAERASLTKVGHTQLSSSTNSTDETSAATPKAIKEANDNANSRILKSMINKPGGVIGIDEFGKALPEFLPDVMQKIAEVNLATTPAAEFSYANLSKYKELELRLYDVGQSGAGSSNMVLKINDITTNAIIALSSISSASGSLATYGPTAVITSGTPSNMYRGRIHFFNRINAIDFYASTLKSAADNNFTTNDRYLNELTGKVHSTVEKINKLSLYSQAGVLYNRGRVELWGMSE